MVIIYYRTYYCYFWKIYGNYWHREIFRVRIYILIIIYSLFGYKSGICLRDLAFISYAGVIRGAVAFGLVLRIEHDVEHRSVIVTTCLAIVCFTTVVLGSTVATV